MIVYIYENHIRAIVDKSSSSLKKKSVVIRQINNRHQKFYFFLHFLFFIGTVHNRLRHNSDDYVPHEPLPDLVPMARGRDRSISLPDVPALREAQETEVGKELRRISDEFHFSYHTPRQVRSFVIFKNNYPKCKFLCRVLKLF